MVTNVTSLTRNGLRDWIIQRVSAVVIGLYTLCVLGFMIKHYGNIDFATWQAFMKNPVMQIFSFIALLSIVFHSWVGVWTVLTDYIKPYKLRLFLEVLLVLALFSFLAWGVSILWG